MNKDKVERLLKNSKTQIKNKKKKIDWLKEAGVEKEINLYQNKRLKLLKVKYYIHF